MHSCIPSTIKPELLQFICVTLGEYLNLSGLFVKGVSQMMLSLLLGPRDAEFPGCFAYRPTWARCTGSEGVPSYELFWGLLSPS